MRRSISTFAYLFILTSLGCTQKDQPQARALASDDITNLAGPQAEQAKWLRTIAIAMIAHSDETRNGRLLPEDDESWRVALGRATKAYEPNQLRDAAGKTRLLLVTGPGTFFDSASPVGGMRRLVEQAPRPASTIPHVIVVGPDRAVDVEETRDFVFDPGDPKAGLGDLEDSFLVLMTDGSVHGFPKSISAAAFTVLCQVEPQIDEKEFKAIAPELERLGLPSTLPRGRSKAVLE